MTSLKELNIFHKQLFPQPSRFSFMPYQSFKHTAHADVAIIVKVYHPLMAPFNRILSCAISIIFNNIHISVTIIMYCLPKHIISSKQFNRVFHYLGHKFIFGSDINSINVSNKNDVSTTNPRGELLLYVQYSVTVKNLQDTWYNITNTPKTLFNRVKLLWRSQRGTKKSV